MKEHPVAMFPPPQSAFLLPTPQNPEATSNIVPFSWDTTWPISSRVCSDGDSQPWRWAQPAEGKGFSWTMKKREIVF